MSRLRLFHDANAADEIWMAEIVRMFGARDAGRVRVQGLGEGEPGSHLRTLYERCAAARSAYRAA
jgi:hypothetical protein